MLRSFGLSGLLLAACATSQDVGDGGSGARGGTGANPGAGGAATGGAAGGGAGSPTCATASDEIVPRPVDVIVTVDQSASMGEEIDGVVQNINTNLATILEQANLDYQVILVAGDGPFCITPPLGNGATDPACYESNPPRYFHARAPVNSSDALTLLLWTYGGEYKQPNTCMRNPSPDARWGDQLRFESQKVFIVVTDDDPSSFSAAALGCSNCPNHHCPTFADAPADWGGDDFPTELYRLPPSGMFGTPAEPKWVMHSIVPVQRQLGPSEPVTPLGEVCNFSGNSGETSGVEYQKLSVLSGGLRFPSCNTDYSPVFQEIASTIVPLACAFQLEATNVGTIDPDKTNVEFDPGDGTAAETFLRDDTAACESGANGWQLANGETQVILCGTACDEVKASATGRVTITVGCDAETRTE